MNRGKLKTYYLKLTALTPIHIGTGESYEPTNFVIDNKVLYEFDEILFYKSLCAVDKEAIKNKMGNWLEIIEFYKTKKEEAKEISFFECDVSKEVENKYNARNPNQLQINRTFKNPNTHRAVIAGSSIKGMLDTILGIYVQKIKDNKVRQSLIVSDALLLNGGVEIGCSYRKHRINPDDKKNPQMVEVIKPNSTFIMSLKSKLTFGQIQSMMRAYHKRRDSSLYKEDPKSFVGRVGKYSGMEYMVDSNRNLLNSYGKPLATHVLCSLDVLKDEMFGWLKFELISNESYQESLNVIKEQENDYYKNKKKKQEKILLEIKKLEDELKALELKKQKAKEEEERKEAEAKAKKEAELASMSPVELLVNSYTDIAVLINDMKLGKIEDFETIKYELAKEVKRELQKTPRTWDKAKKKALDRKLYIEELLKYDKSKTT